VTGLERAAGNVRNMGVTVVLAEDAFIVREGVRLLLEEAGYDLKAAVETYDDLLEAVDDHSPQVVITDIRMPPTRTDEGVRAAREIRQSHPDIGVVVLSQYVEADYALKLFEDGADGLAYLLKERLGDIAQLEHAIEEVRANRSVIDPKVVDALIESRSRPKSPMERLTEREAEIIAEMAKGKTNAAIADSLFVSERAVEKHINSIFTKLDLLPERDTNRRVSAVLLFLAEHR
jgi:DNA-binding NarL/FixJ family response regulator